MLYRRLQYNYKVHKLDGSCDHATTTAKKANIESSISWKFVLRIKETQFLKTRNSKLSLGSMPLDPLSKERLRRSIFQSGKPYTQVGTPPCKRLATPLVQRFILEFT